jgi:hypothetical protein
MTIASSGSVGLGVVPAAWNSATSGRTAVQVGFGSIAGRLNDLQTEFSNNAYAVGTGNTPQWAGLTRWNKNQIAMGSDGSIAFNNAPTVTQSAFDTSPDFTWQERMRINASGDWMVSNTVANVASGYSTQEGCGWVDSDTHFEIATISNRSALEIGKNNANDGGLVTFRKQGTTVGSIGTKTGSVYIGTGDAGIGFNHHGGGNLDAIMPYSITAGAFQNGAVDIGGSVNRFKDLYLSGGVVFGATGGSVTSKKLDDYEEGIWTPSLPNGGTLTSNTAYYTKIGRQVHLQFYISVINATAATTAFRIGGLPFTSLAGSTYPAGTISYCADGDLSGVGLLSAQATDYLYFHYIDGTNGLHVTNNEMRALFGTANSGAIIASITYLTAA